MKLFLKSLKLIVPLAGVGLGISWFLLHLAIGFGVFPKSPEPETFHTIPYISHGVTHYLNSCQDSLQRWGIFASLALMVFYWVVLFIWKETYGSRKT